MHQSKKILFTTLLLTSTVFAADIPIESRSLSDVAPVASTSNGNLNWDLVQKNEQLENQLRALRGRIEELENNVDKLSSDLKNRYTDLDQRLELLKQQVDPTEAEPEASTPITTTAPQGVAMNLVPVNVENTASNNENSSNNIAVTIPPTAVNNGTTSNNQNNAAAQARLTPTETVTHDSNTPTEQERAAYTVALEAYKNGGAKQAIIPMQDFIKNYPQSAYIGNAHFWLGEFNLATDPVNYEEAKRNYSIVIREYANSAKASRALFQLYNISLDVEKNKNMADKYKSQLLKYHPNSEEAQYFSKRK